MHHADTRPCAQPAKLDRHKVRGEINVGEAHVSQIIKLAIKDHIGNIANHPVILQSSAIGDRVLRKISPGGRKMQRIVGDFLEPEATGCRATDADGHVGLAF